MGFFDKLTSGLKDTPSYWSTITNSNQLDEIIEESKTQPVAIFKHSTRCGISFNIKYNLEENWDFEEKDLKFYYLDLIAYRSISNLVAQKFGIIHQSPQVIMLKNGKVVFDTSHHMISTKAIRQHL